MPAIMLLYAVVSVVGINWGLPSRRIDNYLFGSAKPWSGETIARLAGAAAKASASRGADVDADPLAKGDEPILLNATDEQAAAIYLRYRLYTHQPDEMITMMALSQMRPGQGDFDPRMYQYGGLFIYPVGALIGACGAVGLIDVRSDLTYYLDNPGEFGRFYVAARAYVAAWGLAGVVVVYLIGRRLYDHRAGLLAALLFAVVPVVVCMSHEAKPHLPGAVLMLAATLLAMRYSQSGRRRDWLGLCVACGAAFGMVLSSLPVFILIPLMELVRVNDGATTLRRAVQRAVLGVGLAGGVYLVTNPYLVINLFVNPEVLRSNFGNSLAMYEVSRLGEGFVRMLELTIEGAGLPVLLVGVFGVAYLVQHRQREAVPIGVLAGLIFVQFVLIGAGKPAEYGRFGVFTNTVLAIAAAGVLSRPWTLRYRGAHWVASGVVVVWVGIFGGRYLLNFVADTSESNTRTATAEFLAAHQGPMAVLAEPAPYCCPPVDFANRRVWLFPSRERWADEGTGPAEAQDRSYPSILITAADDIPLPASGTYIPYRHGSKSLHDGTAVDRPPWATPISWANKPVIVQLSEHGQEAMPRPDD